MLTLTSNLLRSEGVTLAPLTLIVGDNFAARMIGLHRVLRSLTDQTLYSGVEYATATELPDMRTWQVPPAPGESALPLLIEEVHYPVARDLLEEVALDEEAGRIFETLTGEKAADKLANRSDSDLFFSELASVVSDLMGHGGPCSPCVLVIHDAVQGKCHGSATACDRLAAFLCGFADPARGRHVVVGCNGDILEAVRAAVDRGDLDAQDLAVLGG